MHVMLMQGELTCDLLCVSGSSNIQVLMIFIEPHVH